jgi:bacterioferritin-associated ferredoxin
LPVRVSDRCAVALGHRPNFIALALANTNHSYYSRRMIICVCHRVSDRDIARAAREGCPSFDDLQIDMGVATSCGKCHECAMQTFERHAGAVSAAAHHTAVCHADPQHATLSMPLSMPLSMSLSMSMTLPHSIRHDAGAAAAA